MKSKARLNLKGKSFQKLAKKNMDGVNQTSFIKNFLVMRDQFSPFTKILNGLLMAATKLKIKI